MCSFIRACAVTDLMVMPGLINLDFADIRTVMSEMGKAIRGPAKPVAIAAPRCRRSRDNNPLLEDVDEGARGVLINITGGTDMTLFESTRRPTGSARRSTPTPTSFSARPLTKSSPARCASGVATENDAELAPGSGARHRGARGPTASRPCAIWSAYTQPILTQMRAARRLRAIPGPKRTPGPAGPAGGRGGGKRCGARWRLCRAAAGGSRPARPVPVVPPPAPAAGSLPAGAPLAATMLGR